MLTFAALVDQHNRISFKLFNKHPTQFPDGLRSKVLVGLFSHDNYHSLDLLVIIT